MYKELQQEKIGLKTENSWMFFVTIVESVYITFTFKCGQKIVQTSWSQTHCSVKAFSPVLTLLLSDASTGTATELL